ncbi:DUF397 domain-containing protein [Streptomyces bottropensis]|uniref:DUF397 domain-containing protein n=1 Tax=Streptomyces bottropensis TaxID=42235 RepID=UPI0036B39D46
MSTPELTWFKSSYSSSASGDCVEVAVAVAVAAPLPHTIHIRDSKNPTGPLLTLSPAAWAEFVPYAAQE